MLHCLCAKQTMCLNMIVRDESDVILRCLKSVVDVIDYWVIVDTGSKDDTIKKIRKFLKHIPGELYQRPWRNFGENRSEAFNLAQGKTDYILFMDADDILKFSDKKTFGNLTHECYNFWRGTDDFSYLKPQIVQANIPWKWVGVTHEYIECGRPYTSAIMEGVRYITKPGGACSKHPTKKFFRNIDLLEADLKKDPHNPRSMFYLAESYRDAQKPGDALVCYQKRIALGGWQEEVFWSYLQIAILLENMGLSKKIVERAYLDAHEYRKKRVEPVYFLAKLYNRFGEYADCYVLIKRYLQEPKYARDILFNMDWVDQYGLLFEYSIAAYYIGEYQQAKKISAQLLHHPKLPYHWKEFVMKNLVLASNQLEKTS